MFKLFVFACLLAVAAASGVGVASTYAAPSVVSPYAYSGLGYTGGYYGSYPYTSAYASPLTYSGYGSYGSPYVRSLAYSGYGGYPYTVYPYAGYKYAYYVHSGTTFQRFKNTTSSGSEVDVLFQQLKNVSVLDFTTPNANKTTKKM